MERAEAIKKIRQMSLPKETMEILEALAPELKESEDERIRKFFAELATDACGGPGQEYYEELGLNYDKVMGWLEKQKDHFRDDTKMVEQKPAEWSDTKELVFKDICKHLKEEGYNGWVTLLEALHSGEFKQAVTEWSEEDENMLKCCLVAINHYEKTCNIGKYIPAKFNKDGYLASVDKVKSWLKSLRPSWKPSEEQMEALWEVEGRMRTNKAFTLSNRLASLYNDLQKLM